MTGVAIAQGGSIYEATLAEPNQKTQKSAQEVVRRICREQRYRPGYPETFGIRGWPHSGRTER